MSVELLFSLPLGRDPFSMGSHLLGALLSLAATVVAVRRACRNGRSGLRAGGYGLSMTIAFGASALFHYMPSTSALADLYQKIDHAAIFLMIAGTGTAMYGAFDMKRARRLTGLLWIAAALGIALKLTLWPMPSWLSAAIYLTLGWLGLGGLAALIRSRSVERPPLYLFVLGAIAYTAGALVFAADAPALWPGAIDAHGTFHLLVLAGAAFHFGFIYRYCLQADASTPAPEPARATRQERPAQPDTSTG